MRGTLRHNRILYNNKVTELSAHKMGLILGRAKKFLIYPQSQVSLGPTWTLPNKCGGLFHQ